MTEKEFDTQKELFEQRDKISEELKKLQGEYNHEILQLGSKFNPKINKLIKELGENRIKLHESGVSAEDC